MKEDLQKIIKQFVDFLLPLLTPYKAGLYIFLLRNSYIKNGTREIRIGERTIAANLGASRGEKKNYNHVTKLVTGLEEKSCIKIGDTTREKTLYSVFLPGEIPSVKEKLSIVADPIEDNYFKDPEKRKDIFERDKYTCHYCGEKSCRKMPHLTTLSRNMSAENTQRKI